MKPAWPDKCRHNRPQDSFLGTIHLGWKAYDVFVFLNTVGDGLQGMHVCVRYGQKPWEYLSLGSAIQVAERENDPLWMKDELRKEISKLVGKWLAAYIGV